MAKWYGSLTNRLEENKIYKENKLIEVGDDATEYLYSDRHAWYVTKVDNQKHIWIKRYEVIADQTKEGGMGHQNWVYIKDANQPEVELKFRYGKWQIVTKFNKESYEKLVAREGNEDIAKMYMHLGGLNSDEIISIINDNDEVVKYKDFGNISFGVKEYYYDWEF